jgi:hypothetical protein
MKLSCREPCKRASLTRNLLRGPRAHNLMPVALTAPTDVRRRVAMPVVPGPHSGQQPMKSGTKADST